MGPAPSTLYRRAGGHEVGSAGGARLQGGRTARGSARAPARASPPHRPAERLGCLTGSAPGRNRGSGRSPNRSHALKGVRCSGLALRPGFRPKARKPPNAPSGARDDEEPRQTEFELQGQYLVVASGYVANGTARAWASACESRAAATRYRAGGPHEFNGDDRCRRAWSVRLSRKAGKATGDTTGPGVGVSAVRDSCELAVTASGGIRGRARRRIGQNMGNRRQAAASGERRA